MFSVMNQAANLVLFHFPNSLLFVSAGYGFVDFDSPTSAQKAVTALKAGGVQAQMAKVRTPRRSVSIWWIPLKSILFKLK